MASIMIYSGMDEEFSLPEDTVCSRRRCCLWMPCLHCHRLTFSVRSNWWQGMTDEDKADGNRCWSRGLSPLKKIKEWSELVIPKLKTLIRRFNKQRCKHGEFRYDPTSYLLNFDEHLEDDDRPLRNFSMRYSSILVPGKPLMKLGEIGRRLPDDEVVLH